MRTITSVDQRHSRGRGRRNNGQTVRCYLGAIENIFARASLGGALPRLTRQGFNTKAVSGLLFWVFLYTNFKNINLPAEHFRSVLKSALTSNKKKWRFVSIWFLSWVSLSEFCRRKPGWRFTAGAKFLMLHAAIQSDIAPVEKQFRPGFGRPILKET